MEQTVLLKCHEATQHRHKLQKLHCHQVLDETTWHKIKKFHLLWCVLIQNNYSSLSSFSHCCLCTLHTPFPESTFPYLNWYPLTSHFLKSRYSKETNDHMPATKTKAKKKNPCQKSPWAFHLHFVPLSCTCLLNWKFSSLRLPCCIPAYY